MPRFLAAAVRSMGAMNAAMHLASHLGSAHTVPERSSNTTTPIPCRYPSAGINISASRPICCTSLAPDKAVTDSRGTFWCFTNVSTTLASAFHRRGICHLANETAASYVNCRSCSSRERLRSDPTADVRTQPFTTHLPACTRRALSSTNHAAWLSTSFNWPSTRSSFVPTSTTPQLPAPRSSSRWLSRSSHIPTCRSCSSAATSNGKHTRYTVPLPDRKNS
mmetsp:Transcript_7887/g.18917  ORF Transcript_7887/g.18917 Transcript_7887/m.18917 type:complete len:221 (-) Transcript_7887:628-1290(-)